MYSVVIDEISSINRPTPCPTYEVFHLALISHKKFTSLAIRGKNRWMGSLWKKVILLSFLIFHNYWCGRYYAVKKSDRAQFLRKNYPAQPAVAIRIVWALRISTQLARPTISVHNARTKATDAPGILNFEIQAEFLKATHMERTRKWFGDTYWTILNSLQYFCKSPHFDNPGWTHTQHPSQGKLLHILR